MLKHSGSLMVIIDYALHADDRKVRKSGNKLLRHSLSSLTEFYPMGREYVALQSAKPGTPAPVPENPEWHSPSGEEIDFAVSLLRKFVLPSMKVMEETIRAGNDASLEDWRRSAKTVYYGLRGCIGILNDRTREGCDDGRGGSSGFGVDDMHELTDFDSCDGKSTKKSTKKSTLLRFLHPFEKAVIAVLSIASSISREFLYDFRYKLTKFIGDCMASVNTSLEPEFEFQRDRKGAKELLNCASLLLRKRVNRKSSNLEACRKLARHSGNNVMRTRCEAIIVSKLRTSHTFSPVPFADGDDGGRSVSKRNVAVRINVCHQEMARRASFEIPWRLKKNSDSGDDLDGSTLAGYARLVMLFLFSFRRFLCVLFRYA